MDEIAAWLERLRPRIELLARGRHNGEDLFGEVALACIEKCHRYDWSHPKIEGLIMRIAKNLWIKHLRRERLRKPACLPVGECSALVREHSTAFETQPCDVDATRCQAVVDSLPDRYRQVVQERFFEGKRLQLAFRSSGIDT